MELRLEAGAQTEFNLPLPGAELHFEAIALNLCFRAPASPKLLVVSS